MNLIKKTWFKRFLLIFSGVAVVSGIATYFTIKYLNNHEVEENKKTDFIVSIEGAVENPGDYKFNSPKTLREILFIPSLKSNADTSSIDLEEVICSDQNIFIPFILGTIEKIKWSDLKTIEQLTNRGIKKATAKKIIEFRRKNSTTTWEQIHAIKGIGQVTLNQLKEVIELT